MRKFLEYPIFWILISQYPIINLYAANQEFIPIEQVYSSLGLSFLVNLIIFSFSGLITRRWKNAALITSIFTLTFFSYAHVSRVINIPGIKLNTFQLNPFFVVWSVGLLLLVYLAIRVRITNGIVTIINISTFILVFLPISQVIYSRVSVSPHYIEEARKQLSQIRVDGSSGGGQVVADTETYPDIYLIIVDSYMRGDKLIANYGFDNSYFTRSLEDRGFYIARDARSNYLNTTYSLNTLMNLVYFEDFPLVLQKASRLNLHTNYVSDFLREKGYEIVVFDSGTGDSNFQYADRFITPSPAPDNNQEYLNSFEVLLIQTTSLSVLFQPANNNLNEIGNQHAIAINRDLNIRRARVFSAFSHLPDYSDDDKPQFLFAHIYTPHIPFLFDENGDGLKYTSNLNLNWFDVPSADYRFAYTNQIKKVNELILATVDAIQAKSTRPHIILIQADHGDDYYLDWDHPTNSGVDARSSILYAVYYSDEEYGDFYPAITTVNTFRNVFNHWFQTGFPLLPDKVSFHKHAGTLSSTQRPVFWDACANYSVCIQPYSK